MKCMRTVSSALTSAAVACLLTGAVQAAPPVPYTGSGSATSPEPKQQATLSDLLRRESEKFSLAVVIEGGLPVISIEDKEVQRILSLDRRESLIELGKLVGKFNLEAKVNEPVLLITKRYLKGENFPPNVTLRECRFAVNQMLVGLKRLLPELNVHDEDITGSSVKQLADSMSEAQWQKLAAPSGCPVNELSPKQQRLVTLWAVSLHVESLVQELRFAESRLDQAITKMPVIRYVPGAEIASNFPAGSYLACDLTKLDSPRHFILLDQLDTVLDSSQGIVVFNTPVNLSNRTPEEKVASDALPQLNPPAANVKGLDLPDETVRIDSILQDLNSLTSKTKISFVSYDDIKDKRVSIIGRKYAEPIAVASSAAKVCGFTLASAKNGKEYTLRPPLLRSMEVSKIGDAMMKVVPEPLLIAWEDTKVIMGDEVIVKDGKPTKVPRTRRELKLFASNCLKSITDEAFSAKHVKAISLFELAPEAESSLANILVAPLISFLGGLRDTGINPVLMDSNKLCLTGAHFTDEKGKSRVTIFVSEVLEDGKLAMKAGSQGRLYTPGK